MALGTTAVASARRNETLSGLSKPPSRPSLGRAFTQRCLPHLNDTANPDIGHSRQCTLHDALDALPVPPGDRRHERHGAGDVISVSRVLKRQDHAVPSRSAQLVYIVNLPDTAPLISVAACPSAGTAISPLRPAISGWSRVT